MIPLAHSCAFQYCSGEDDVKPNENEERNDGSEREPYEPPRIVYREPLEAVAGVCQPVGKAEGQVGCEAVQQS